MTFVVGDIIQIYPPTVDHKKYEICLGADELSVTICIFLNSENRYEGGLPFQCDKFPMIPESDTGLTVVSLSNLERYSERHLTIYRAEKLGELSKDIAAEIIKACDTVRTLNRREKDFIVQKLTLYLGA